MMRKSWTDDSWNKKFNSVIKNKKTLRWNYKDSQNTESESVRSGIKKFNVVKFNTVKCGKGFDRRYDEKDKIEYDYDDRGNLIIKNRDNSR